MSDINSYANLALAAYGDFNVGTPSIPELRRIGMAPRQADQFATQWRIVDQYNETHTVDVIDPTTGTMVQHRWGPSIRWCRSRSCSRRGRKRLPRRRQRFRRL